MSKENPALVYITVSGSPYIEGVLLTLHDGDRENPQTMTSYFFPDDRNEDDPYAYTAHIEYDW